VLIYVNSCCVFRGVFAVHLTWRIHLALANTSNFIVVAYFVDSVESCFISRTCLLLYSRAFLCDILPLQLFTVQSFMCFKLDIMYYCLQFDFSVTLRQIFPETLRYRLQYIQICVHKIMYIRLRLLYVIKKSAMWSLVLKNFECLPIIK